MLTNTAKHPISFTVDGKKYTAAPGGPVTPAVPPAKERGVLKIKGLPVVSDLPSEEEEHEAQDAEPAHAPAKPSKAPPPKAGAPMPKLPPTPTEKAGDAKGEGDGKDAGDGKGSGGK